MKSNKGITLTALIITVIVIVLLSGVVLYTITSDNGLLRNIEKSIEKYNFAEIKEKIELINSEIRISKQMDSKYVIDIVAINVEVLGEESGNDIYELVEDENGLVILVIKDSNEEGISEEIKLARQEAIENQEIVAGYTPIYTAEQLKLIGQGGTHEVTTASGISKGNYPFELNTNYILMDNIVLDSSEAWNCIGMSSPFTGIFDGNYYTIHNLTMNASTITGSYYGLFHSVNGGTIKNLTMNSVNIANASRGGTAAIAGELNNSTIKNCIVKCNINNNSTMVGVIASRANNSTISGCKADIVMDLYSSNCAGISAYPSNTIIDNCRVNIDVSCTGDNIAGIAAYPNNGTKIANCVVTGTINGGGYVGGIAGSCYCDIENCISFAKVTASGNTAGGIVGLLYGNIKNCYSIGNVAGNEEVGGIVGKHGGQMIECCYSTGTINGTSYVGGISGLSTSTNHFLNCYSKGDVTGDSSIGGLVGKAFASNVKIEKCYAVSNVPATGTNIGKLVGEHSQNIGVISSYYSTEVEGIEGDIGYGLTSAEMKQASSYAGWSFDSNPWAIDEGKTLPYLITLSDYKPTI